MADLFFVDLLLLYIIVNVVNYIIHLEAEGKHYKEIFLD
ncbi:hypothetical protein C3B55_00627 [Candidatus Pseudomonas adelgestsugas]|uniref:Uncharacterized protein n=1 Tax=Candidatus Pseudomonas adelgestsugas TaxID=1302376 RepID=A0ABX5R8H9_9PSED|nr:hypothetical protein C3B55_00627 [Candidatus Pseudomonas adelgestsugas]